MFHDPLHPIFNIAIFSGNRFRWCANRDSEHADFILLCKQGEIWVSVEGTDETDEHQSRYEKGLEGYFFDMKLVEDIFLKIHEQGYNKTYFTRTDVGLVYRDGQLLAT